MDSSPCRGAAVPDTDMIDLKSLIDDAKCFAMIRQYRWPDGVRCPACASASIVQNGRDDTQPDRQRYLCKACHGRFDDLTGSVFAGRHQPLKVWVLCLYFMGLNLSNKQIAKELGLNEGDAQIMTTQLRENLVAKAPEETLDGAIEADEVYVVAGHKGNPAAVEKKGAKDVGGVSRARAGVGRLTRRSRRSSG
jgi:transposase-like protein